MIDLQVGQMWLVPDTGIVRTILAIDSGYVTFERSHPCRSLPGVDGISYMSVRGFKTLVSYHTLIDKRLEVPHGL